MGKIKNSSRKLPSFFQGKTEKLTLQKAEEEIGGKSQREISYSEAKEELKTADIRHKKGLKKFMFYFKILAISVVGLISLVCLSVIYFIAIKQFLGYETQTIYAISWVIPQTISFVFGGVIGYFICYLNWSF